MQIAQTLGRKVFLLLHRVQFRRTRTAGLINEADEKEDGWVVTGVAAAVVAAMAVTKGVARDARLKEAAGYIRAPIVHLFNNSRRVRVNSITTTSRSCRNL